MEVLGLIAGLPGLIEIIQKTAGVASQLKNWNSLAGEMDVLLQQLHGLESTLKMVQDRGTCPSISPTQVDHFRTSLDNIRNDMTNLNKLLTRCNTSTQKGGMRFMRQVKLLLTGFNKTTKKHIQRIRDTRAELTLALVGQIHQGCGKSALSASITEALEAKGKISTFFSFWAGSESQRKFTGFLKTALWQLLRHLSAEEISQVSSILMKLSSYDERSLRDALHFAVEAIKSAVYMIIDGVDEAETDWNDPEDRSLSTIFDLLKAHSNAQVLLCGRETSLSRAIASSSSSLKISQDFLRNDINTFIEWHLDQSFKSHVKESRNLVRESLQTKSEMMFLWVNLIFKELNRSPSASAMRAILNNTPPTLDEEYSRMFESLMKRSGGYSTRPSVTMKAVKRIFSLVLAAPEPLTLAELGYACAAESTITSALEYEPMTREGLVDSCGDFVNESNDHFHFAHASIEEFLTRPLNEWGEADRNVLYFRLDRLQSQGSLLESCFNYIRSMEMGYPIHDRSMQSLPQRYPFFQYASRFIPVLLAIEMPIITRSLLEDFIASKHFCGLIEYIVHTLEMDSWNLFFQYVYLLYSLKDANLPRSAVLASVKVELDRREKELGEQDPRYQTWASIGGMLSAFLATIDPDFEQQDAPITHAPRLLDQARTHASPLTIQLTAPRHGATLAQILPNVSTLLHSRLLGSLRSVPIEILPTWALILWALKFYHGGAGNGPRARQMLQTAHRRVKNRRTFTESVCLLFLGFIDLDDHEVAIRHDVSNCDMSCHFRESLEIAQGLPSSPQVEAVIHGALCAMTEGLLLHKDRENAITYSRQLESNICGNEVVQEDNGWLKRMFYRGSAWAKWRVHLLEVHTETLEKYEFNEDSMRLNQFALDLYTERNWDHVPSILMWRWHISRILWDLGKVEECRLSLQAMLENLKRFEGTQYHTEYWLGTVDLTTGCLLAQGKEDEARQLLMRIPVALILQISEQEHSLGTSLLRVGCVDRALELYNIWGREKLLEDLRELGWDRLVGDAAVERMLEMGADAKNELGTTALLYASAEGNKALTKFSKSRTDGHN